MKKLFCIICVSKENLKPLKYHTSSKKTLVPSTIGSKCRNEDQKLFTEEESIEILKDLDLFKKYNFF